MWKLISRKEVRDFDGFWTEYSLYGDGEKFVCVFGDSDIYGPEDESSWDFETESEMEAIEWFDCYEGYEDEDCDMWNDDYSLNLPCDNSGLCAGSGCPNYYACQC